MGFRRPKIQTTHTRTFAHMELNHSYNLHPEVVFLLTWPEAVAQITLHLTL